MNKTFRYELKPNNKQVTLFKKACGVARFTWNWGLARRKELYYTKQGKERFTTAITQGKELVALKKTKYQWMYDVSNRVMQYSLRDLEQAYLYFGKGQKQKDKVGLPRFKKKGIHDKFRLGNDFCSQNTRTRSIEIKDNKIKLPCIGWVRVKESFDKFYGEIINATISREGDRWFCCLCVEVGDILPKQINGDIIGIDLGIKCFATISDGNDIQQINSPKPLRKHLKKFSRLSKKHTKKKKCSKNKKKIGRKLSKLSYKIKNTRRDFLAKLSSELAKTKSVICVEDLGVDNMLRNRYLRKQISDEGWGTFRRMLAYKTNWYGSRLLVIPRFEPSSKRCNSCGKVNKDLKLADRVWVCSYCGAVNERDPNASKNIRDYGIKQLTTESYAGSKACGVDVRQSCEIAIDKEAGSRHKSKSYITEAHDHQRGLKL